MAAKVKVSKLLQEIRAFAEIANRRPLPRSAALLLAQMRPSVIQPVLPRRRLYVASAQQDGFDIPRPVKISHLKPGPAPGLSPPAA